ncbi:MAG: GNAT family N-acetyltransferase [Chitinophagales bacterium]
MKEYIISSTEKIKLVEFGTVDYDHIVDLRYEILRRPLKLNFTSRQLAEEKNFYHLGYYYNNKLVACLMLVPENNGKMKMKQVAVANEFQGKGIGAKLVLTSENFAKEKGFGIMYCHARDKAIPFYKKLGYHSVGEMFEEVTIPHMEMEKQLTQPD